MKKLMNRFNKSRHLDKHFFYITLTHTLKVMYVI